MQVNTAAKAGFTQPAAAEQLASTALTIDHLSFWKANALMAMATKPPPPQLTVSLAVQPGHCASPAAHTSTEKRLAGYWCNVCFCPFPPSSLLHLELATYVPGSFFQAGLFPYTLLEVSADDVDTYWDFAGFLRSAISEQKDALALSCPVHTGLQPHDLAGGLWLSGDPFTGGLCSLLSLIPVPCSSGAGGAGQGTWGSDMSSSLLGMAGCVVLGVLGLGASEPCIIGWVLPAVAWPFMCSFLMWCTTAAALKACWGGREKPHSEHEHPVCWMNVVHTKEQQGGNAELLGAAGMFAQRAENARSWHKHGEYHRLQTADAFEDYNFF